MTDRENVIKGLEDIVEFFEIMTIVEPRCTELKEDAENAISLLKEQQERIEMLESLRRIEQKGR